MFFNLFGMDREREAALELYSDIIVQARQTAFYERMEVPDTREGRFDLITLHMFLVLTRLKEDPRKTGRFGQKLFDVMFRNMDHSLREMGVGDLTVGKKVRGLAEAFYGRVAVYQKAMDENDMSALKRAFARNIYGNEDQQGAAIAALMDYVSLTLDTLREQSVERLLLGIVSFPETGAAVTEPATGGQ